MSPGQWLLAGAMVFAGISHLFWARREFQAQVPDWTGKVIDKDGVVVTSGVVEIMLGGALVALPRERSRVGAILAAFYVAIFPGNISQFVTQTDAFGLNSDTARGVRLLFQPVLVLGVLWATGAWRGTRPMCCCFNPRTATASATACGPSAAPASCCDPRCSTSAMSCWRPRPFPRCPSA